MTTFVRHFSRISLLTISLALTSLCVSQAALAEMSSSKAASTAKGQHGGKVLNVSKISSKNGRATYKVKLLLKNGRVKTVTVSG